MPFKTILVCLNDVERVPVLLHLAADIGAKEDAHVIGLYVVPAPRVYPAMGPGMAPQVLEEFPQFVRSRSAAVKRQFETSMETRGIAREWLLVEGRTSEFADAVIEHSRQSDLVVVNQTSAESDSGIEVDFTERVVMECGRPVLMVPAWGNFADCGRHILVGWKQSREAARATFDALSLLRRANTVHIALVESDGSGEEREDVHETELADALARHGANVRIERLRTSIDVGNALLSHASDIGADLLVMGAYGHSRMREHVFGGATRTVLQSMTVPVLMSH
ncbi:MAG TPA: universal stress protein [Nitrospira sp.]|nr:universal stress protein [Nitrospira sp.]